MSCKSLKSPGRVTCLVLSFLVLFLSYKPATALLAIAGAAKNPTDGRHAGEGSQVDARENLPRPARKQQRQAPGRIVQKIQKSRTLSDAEKILLHVLQSGPGNLGRLSTCSRQIESESTKPDYLRLFLPANPGSPHSPPA